MKKFWLVLILIVGGFSSAYCQLIYISISDRSSYECRSTGETFYPKLDLKENYRTQDLFFKDKLIFDKSLLPNNYASTCYEVFNDTILFITFIKEDQRGVSHPRLYKREDVNIICFNNPSVIYQVNLGGRKILSDVEILNKFKLFRLPTDEYYAITDFNLEYLTLTSNRDNVEMFKISIRQSAFTTTENLDEETPCSTEAAP